MIIKPNWNSFKSKFIDSPQNNFEWFCYLLFCKEYDVSYIFRYKNQTALETNPIPYYNDNPTSSKNEIIGWQAKFYETKLSSNKVELKKTIIKAKEKYPEITKLIFYTNQEWGQGKEENDSQEKQELTKTAKNIGIELIWNCESFFQSPFVSEENANIASYFFEQNSKIDSILKLQEHTENILFEINTSIPFGDNEIIISRENFLDDIQKALLLNQLFIISGDGGVGKTAIIKRLYEEWHDDISILLFKASEFNLNNINDLFSGFDLSDFIRFYDETKEKVLVIDSAEKILDIKNTDPLKEFLSSLVKNDWKIIFTTRNNFLNDLLYQFIEIYRINPIIKNIKNCDLKELIFLSKKFDFLLPKDNKLLNLIKNPFYFKEYLSIYSSDLTNDYITFKDSIWNKLIKKGNIKREQSFLELVLKRVRNGGFYIEEINNQSELQSFVTEGILGYENSRYFITHDIYEEWALEVFIKVSYQNRGSNIKFFNTIGNELAIRRSFRSWVSEKLLLDDEDIKSFIEDVIDDKDIEVFWKDKILVSVLLSDYSKTFFEVFSNDLLMNEFDLLKKLSFLLRVACKQNDESFLSQYKIKDEYLPSIQYIFTQPLGKGWDSFIEFVHNNLEKLDYKIVAFILPVLYEYVSKHKEGITTKYASKIALNHYRWAKKRVHAYNYNSGKLYQTIIYGSGEIVDELKEFFEEVLISDKDRIDGLSQYVLTKMDGGILAQNLPSEVIKLANFYWFKKSEIDYNSFKMDIEEYYCITDYYEFKYFPSSAYQTPIYALLKTSFNETLDFIIEFTNKTVGCYANSKSKYEKSIREVKLYIDENIFTQYHSNGLWQIYRGTSSPVTPDLLQSIHMALENFLLEISKTWDKKSLETIFKYILIKSKSSSLSAVVASIVIANPEKLFNIAEILFKTKKFIRSDFQRSLMEYSSTSNWSLLSGNNEIYDYEREESSKENHRDKHLENIFLNYQFFRTEETSEDESVRRQKVLWEILDNYYSKLPDKDDENDSDKKWRISLSRMDKRKMSPKIEEHKNGFLIDFNPKIENDLEEYIESSQKENSEALKYTNVHLWASQKLSGNEEYKQYVEYEEDYKLVIEKVKEFLLDDEKDQYLAYDSIPSEVCSVLLKYDLKQLNKEEITFCKEVIFEFVSIQFQDNYRYQIHDGLKPAIYSLPILYTEYAIEKEQVKFFIFISLFNDHSVSMGNEHVYNFAINSIHRNLSIFTEDDLKSFILGYLLLKPKYLSEVYERSNTSKTKIKDFIDKYVSKIEQIISNTITIDKLENIAEIDFEVLSVVFEMIPNNTNELLFKDISRQIIDRFFFLMLDEDEKVEVYTRFKFLRKLAVFLLYSTKDDIQKYLLFILEQFNGSEVFADFLYEIVTAQDELECYESFWYIDKIMRNFLFAAYPWKEGIKEWHTIKEQNRRFFKDITLKTGHCPSVFFSIIKVLNDICSLYLKDGISWLSEVISSNNLLDKKFEGNTIYYFELVMKRFIYIHREDIKKQPKVKKEVLVILDFLIQKQSAMAYMLREDIY